jgi:photosystem II stability/assembly factor-like uncharacterized protein
VATTQAQPALTSAVFGNGKFVVGGPSELLMISENGKDWTTTHSSETENYIWDLVWFKGAYVALARTALLRSLDGLTRPAFLPGNPP